MHLPISLKALLKENMKINIHWPETVLKRPGKLEKPLPFKSLLARFPLNFIALMGLK
jgi:hypothetical protein